jgi:hypothetical protein
MDALAQSSWIKSCAFYTVKYVKSIKVVGDDTGHFHIPPYHTLELIEVKL